MTQLANRPRSSENIIFPWAHVDDFRRFFGLDQLIGAQSPKSHVHLPLIVSILTRTPHIAGEFLSLQALMTQTITFAQALASNLKISGTLAAANNLDQAIKSGHPSLALEERRKTLAVYLYRNGVLETPQLEARVGPNRLASLLAYHALDFWSQEQSDLFALISRLTSSIQIRYLLAVLLDSIPTNSLSSNQSEQLEAAFAKWPKELEQGIKEYTQAHASR